MRRQIIKITAIFCLLTTIVSTAVISQVKMPIGLVANDDAMFIVVGNEVKGSYHVYDDMSALADLENFSSNRMQKGMLVTIIDADAAAAGDQTKTFMLGGDPAAWEWKEVSLSFVEGTLQSDTVLCEAVVINGDTIVDIAKVGDVISDSTNVVTSVGYVHNAIANGAPEMEFNGERNITRDITIGNTSLKGQNLNAANIAEFLEAVFFPKSAPQIDSLKYAGSETPTIAYADWSSWTPKNDIQLDWQITNISKTIDGLTGAEYDVTSILLKNDDSGSDVTGSPNTFSTNSQLGNFAGVTVNTTGLDAKSEQTKTLTMNVEDAQGSVSTRDIAFTLSPAQEHVLGTPSISGGQYLERTGNDINFNISVPITINDEDITDITIKGSSVASVPAVFTAGPNYTEQSSVFSSTISHVNASVENSTQIYAANQNIQIATVGNIYNNTQSDNSQTVYLVDRAFAGYTSNALTLTEGEFKTFGTKQLNLNPFGMQTTSDGGTTIKNSTGNNYYLVFAIPSYGDATKLFKIETYDLTIWNLDSSSGSYLVNYTNGALSTQYYIVYASNPYALDAEVRARIIEQ